MSDFHSPIDCSMSGSPALHYVPELFRFISTELVMLSNHRSCHPLLFLPSIFASIRVFSMSQIFASGVQSIKSVSFSISPFNEYWGWIFFRIDWIDLLEVQGTLRVFSNTTVQKHQFFGTQLSLWSSSHMTTGKTIALTRQTFVDKVTKVSAF